MMASESKRDSIRQIKTRLEKTEAISRNKSALLRQRQQIEDQLEEAANKLEANALETHRQLASMEEERAIGTEEKRDRLAELEAQRSSLSSLKAKQREIDHLLDELEDDVEAKITDLRESLVETVLDTYPERAEEYADMLAAVDRYTTLSTELEVLGSALEQVELYLDTALGVWDRSKKRSFWHFMFGKSPYTTITDQLSNVATHVTVTLTALNEKVPLAETDPKLQDFLPALRQHLDKMADHTKDRWRYYRFAKTYPVDLERLRTFIHELGQHRQRLQAELREVEQGIQRWIEELTSAL